MKKSQIQILLVRSFVGLFGAVWIALMAFTSAGIPVFGFILAIGSCLVVYAVNAALTGQTQHRVHAKMSMSRKQSG